MSSRADPVAPAVANISLIFGTWSSILTTINSKLYLSYSLARKLGASVLGNTDVVSINNNFGTKCILRFVVSFYKLAAIMLRSAMEPGPPDTHAKNVSPLSSSISCRTVTLNLCRI